MTFTTLPLSVTSYDIQQPSPKAMKRLWAAFELTTHDLEERNKAYQEITDFISR